MIKKRLLPCVIIVVVTAVCVLLSRPTRILFFLALAVVSAFELQNVLFQAELPSSKTLTIVYITAQTVLCWAGAPVKYMAVVFGAAAFAALFWVVLKPVRGAKFAVANLFALVWPFGFYTVIIHAAASDDWLPVLALAVLGTWACDCMALLGGKFFGRHKLAPVVSPHKTWEGAVTGAVFAAVAGVLISLVFGWNMRLCVVVTLISSTFGQVGDLTASLFKRMAGVKDYGHLMPEHGGIMDKMDSMLFSIPVAYLCVLAYMGMIGHA